MRSVCILVANKESRFLLELGRGIVCGYVGKGLRTHPSFCEDHVFTLLSKRPLLHH